MDTRRIIDNCYGDTKYICYGDDTISITLEAYKLDDFVAEPI